MLSYHHYVLPVPACVSEDVVLSLFPVCISFVVPSTAVSVDEATVGIGCLDFTRGDRKQIMAV